MKKLLLFILLASVLLFFSDNAWSDDDLSVKDSDFQKFTEQFDASNADKEFSIESGAAYSYWLPQDIGKAEVKTSGINLFWIEFKTRTQHRLDKFFAIPKLRYETSLTGGDFFYNDDEVIRTSDEEESYMRFLGILQIYKQINFRYETENYIAKIDPITDMNYIPYSGQDIQNIRKGQQLYYETTFFDYALAYESESNLFLGIFYSEYQKPYTATVSGNELFPESIFYSKVSAYGILLEKLHDFSEINGLSVNVSFKFGWGKIQLADNYRITDLLDENEGVAFFNPELTLEYRRNFYKNIEFHLFASADYRHFYRYDEESGNTDNVLGETDINDDLLLKCFVSIAYLF